MEATLTPATILRTVRHMATKANKTKVSVAFIANFQDGSTKVWCNQFWMDNRLMAADMAHGFEGYMSRDTCPLYYRDWSHIKHAAMGQKNCPWKVAAAC